MAEVVLRMEVSEDLAKQLKTVPKSRWTLYVNKVLKEKLAKISRIERILAKSRLTEEKAYEISEKIDKALAERYDRLYDELHG